MANRDGGMKLLNNGNYMRREKMDRKDFEGLEESYIWKVILGMAFPCINLEKILPKISSVDWDKVENLELENISGGPFLGETNMWARKTLLFVQKDNEIKKVGMEKRYIKLFWGLILEVKGRTIKKTLRSRKYHRAYAIQYYAFETKDFLYRSSISIALHNPYLK